VPAADHPQQDMLYEYQKCIACYSCRLSLKVQARSAARCAVLGAVEMWGSFFRGWLFASVLQDRSEVTWAGDVAHRHIRACTMRVLVIREG
jgi:hypothetical protein